MLFKASVFVATLFGLSNATGWNGSLAISMLADGETLSAIGDHMKPLWPVFNSSLPLDNYGKNEFQLRFNRNVTAGARLKKELHSNLYQIFFVKLKPTVAGFKFDEKDQLIYQVGNNTDYSFVRCKRHIDLLNYEGELLMLVKGELKDEKCKEVHVVKKGPAELIKSD